ncbi:uncharacterized protein LOC113239063 [Hyposmocoma kahamanoa]|uniref:uncharacterized protein LOC113239063 n=1 Tax=Hyposmocoma kahamanoa TaxID=1477025 RepID=UPI000E6D75FB|nr:uncharacterized protein LOC113239063 [Hyposmocoma kahamanoa]
METEPEIVKLSRFLMREGDLAIRYLHSAAKETAPARHDPKPRPPRTRRPERKNVYNATAENKEPSIRKSVCLCCGGNHSVPRCWKFSSMTVEDRWKWAKEAYVCFKCLVEKHRRFNCKAKSCGVDSCDSPHHALLHTQRKPVSKPETPKVETVLNTSVLVKENSGSVLLKVCPVSVIGPNGQRANTYALLDEGSTVTLIDAEIADRIGADGPTRKLRIHGLGSSQSEPTSKAVELSICGKSGESHKVIARTVNNLKLARQTIDSSCLEYAHLRGLDRSEVCYNNIKPGILVGADNWHLIVSRQLLVGGRREPVASLTSLGWTVHGTVPKVINSTANENVFHAYTYRADISRTCNDLDERLEDRMKQHFAIDSIGISKIAKPSRSEERALDIFTRTAKRIGHQFEVGLPWKDDVVVMPPSYDMALRRLRTIERKMDASPEFKHKWPTEREESVATEDEVVVSYANEKGSFDHLPDIDRFSSYERLIRTTARVLAFVDMCRRRANRVELRHVQEAERLWLLKSQRDDFNEEIACLARKKPLPRSSKLFKLDPVIGTDGIVRVNGRINAAQIEQSVKSPAVLDGRNVFTRLCIDNIHRRSGHGGRERVANDVRQTYYVLRLRSTVRTVLHGCTFCRLKKVTPFVPAFGDLPAARLDAYSPPFSNCGVDYFGPMIVTIGRRHEKRWGALFTCLTTRAVHLELAASLTTDSAIMALRRMAARRGWPRVIYSDNGTNFRGADAELRAAMREWEPELREFALTQRVDWRYIDPGAPNQGGAWERLVRSVKTALSVTLHDRAPKEEVLLTLLAEAEYTINARPLTHVSVDPAEPEALTPNHFLLGQPNVLPINGTYGRAGK